MHVPEFQLTAVTQLFVCFFCTLSVCFCFRYMCFRAFGGVFEAHSQYTYTRPRELVLPVDSCYFSVRLDARSQPRIGCDALRSGGIFLFHLRRSCCVLLRNTHSRLQWKSFYTYVVFVSFTFCFTFGVLTTPCFFSFSFLCFVCLFFIFWYISGPPERAPSVCSISSTKFTYSAFTRTPHFSTTNQVLGRPFASLTDSLGKNFWLYMSQILLFS